MNYKVSIIIPVYNVEKFLNRCLQTLRNQTLKEIEIIAVNDCSTDASLEILKDFQKEHPENVKIINSKVNVKQGGARNLGIDIAKGEYIGFVDPDDYISTTMFDKMYEAAIQNNADIVACDYFEVNGSTRTYKHNDLPEGDLDTEKKKVILKRKYGWELWQHIFKRELFINNSIRFSEHLFVTDLEIGALLFMYANKIAKVNEGLYFYVKHENATTTFKLNDKKIYDLIIVNDKRLEHFKDRNLYNEFKEELEYVYFWHVCVISVSRCILNFSRPQYSKMEEIKDRIKIKIPEITKNKYYKNSNVYSKFILFFLFHSKTILTFIIKLGNSLPPELKQKVKSLLKK
ncbi:glycosyltransferase family 2 protein [Heyndrickxia coagulans]|uniref:Glycosyltransferase 2-like domain-containing protein n=1 Tax=Heyndrickxia coagulans TaxID=1398 RepID=A0A150KBW5_HEYCO|nr:glycosyltransferase [Heyndrickxia coagulans]KYC67052.1 hypothetical protein B4099_1046 [Heyndrickxia coagulans]